MSMFSQKKKKQKKKACACDTFMSRCSRAHAIFFPHRYSRTVTNNSMRIRFLRMRRPSRSNKENGETLVLYQKKRFRASPQGDKMMGKAPRQCSRKQTQRKTLSPPPLSSPLFTLQAYYICCFDGGQWGEARCTGQ